MITPPPRRETLRQSFSRARSWWIPAALLALTPKCIACLLGYASIGAMLGIGGPELCGATGGASEHLKAWLPPLGALGAIGVFAVRSFRASRHGEQTPADRRQPDRSPGSRDATTRSRRTNEIGI